MVPSLANPHMRYFRADPDSRLPTLGTKLPPRHTHTALDSCCNETAHNRQNTGESDPYCRLSPLPIWLTLVNRAVQLFASVDDFLPKSRGGTNHRMFAETFNACRRESYPTPPSSAYLRDLLLLFGSLLLQGANCSRSYAGSIEWLLKTYFELHE